jgi:hypothetical protein
MAKEIFVGIDLSKDYLEVAVRPGGECYRLITHTPRHCTAQSIPPRTPPKASPSLSGSWLNSLPA